MKKSDIWPLLIVMLAVGFGIGMGVGLNTRQVEMDTVRSSWAGAKQLAEWQKGNLCELYPLIKACEKGDRDACSTAQEKLHKLNPCK